MSESREDDRAATLVVLSYPADLSKRGRWRLGQAYYRKYLRKTVDAVAVGDTWEEFTDVGCCGSTMHVPLRVERVEGGPRVTGDTEITYEEREACGLDHGWAVQNEIERGDPADSADSKPSDSAPGPP